MKTLESYEENGVETSGWRRWLGAAISFAGLTRLTNAFLLFIPFGKLLSLSAEVALSLAGALVGAVGLWLSGRRRENLAEPLLLLVAGIITRVAVAFVSQSFGILGLLMLTVIVGWWANRMYSRVD